MSSNISKAKHTRFLGTADLVEDSGAFEAYDLPNINTNTKSNVKPDKFDVNSKKTKSAGKIKTPEINIQQGSFQFCYESDNESNQSNNLVENKSVETPDISSIEIKNEEHMVQIDQNIGNIPLSTHQTFNNISNIPLVPIRMLPPFYNQYYPSNLFNRPVIHPMNCTYTQPLVEYNNSFQPINKINVANANVPPVNYQTTYFQRLDVVEGLFKFIIQILRSPDKPSIDQIENLKRMLDSLLVDNSQKPTSK